MGQDLPLAVTFRWRFGGKAMSAMGNHGPAGALGQEETFKILIQSSRLRIRDESKIRGYSVHPAGINLYPALMRATASHRVSYEKMGSMERWQESSD